VNQISTPITIRTGSRLHCGLFSDCQPGGYRHQGMGMMIESPGLQITATLTSALTNRINAPEEIRQRIERALAKLDQSLSQQDKRRFLEFQVDKTIPLHCGFGAGTQLALAVGKLWAWFNQPELTTQQLARLLKRSQRSCIGTFGFDSGGMLIDQGIAAGEDVGQCRFRTSLPDSWRILLVRPPELQGFSGETEAKAFQHLPELAPERIARLQQLLRIMQTKSDCFNTFSAALREYGLIVGESFAAVQGGCFSASIGQPVFDLLSSHGLQGIAQSSWGPTIFGLCESSRQAVQLREITLNNFPKLDVTITRLHNEGARISG